MKKLLTFLIAVSMISTLFCAVPAGAATVDEKVVFVRDGGSGDGSSPDAPLSDIHKAYNILGDEGGRIGFATVLWAMPVSPAILRMRVLYRRAGSL